MGNAQRKKRKDDEQHRKQEQQDKDKVEEDQLEAEDIKKPPNGTDDGREQLKEMRGREVRRK